MSLPAIREKIITYFGDGADVHALKALGGRGMGTILVNGGGGPLPLPRAEQVRLVEEQYQSITPSIDLPIDNVKTCLQCGKALRLHLTAHHLGPKPIEGHARTLEDCQRLTNLPIVGLRGYSKAVPREWWPYIETFYTWDDKSYQQDTFCSDRCAASYGRRAAAELPHLPQGGEPPVKKSLPHSSVNHYTEEVRYTESGIRY